MNTDIISKNIQKWQQQRQKAQKKALEAKKEALYKAGRFTLHSNITDKWTRVKSFNIWWDVTSERSGACMEVC